MKKFSTAMLLAACMLAVSSISALADTLTIDSYEDPSYVSSTGTWTKGLGTYYYSSSKGATYTFDIGEYLSDYFSASTTDIYEDVDVTYLWSTAWNRAESVLVELYASVDDATAIASTYIDQLNDSSSYLGAYTLSSSSYLKITVAEAGSRVNPSTVTSASIVTIADTVQLTASGATPTPAPEPATMALFGVGLAGLVIRRKIRKK